MERECSENHVVFVKLLKLSRLPFGNGNVVISKSADARLYRSRSLDQQPPQLTIFYPERLTDWQEQSVVSEKTTPMRSVRTLFVPEDGNSLDKPCPFN